MSILDGLSWGSYFNRTCEDVREVNYLRHFDTRVRKFEQQHNELDAKFEDVKNRIEEAKRNNENPTKEVEVWKDTAYFLIQENGKIKGTWSPSSSCPHRRYRQGKRMAKRMLAMKEHVEKCSFGSVARPGKLPGIKYHVSGDFIDFESRKSKLKQLVEAVKDGNHYMVGLQGMGGTGKTTLATQVGKQIEESNEFEKVIFMVVSNAPDINKIRGEIAGELGLHLKEAGEGDHSKQLWSRISNNEKKLLIVLDDVWEKLNLKDIGIPSGADNKSCYVLITTRHSKVCQAMRCQTIVHLHTLPDEDALELFQFHARSNDDFSSNELEDLAREFVKKCGGLPVAIQSLAGTLRNWPISEWKEPLASLQRYEPLLNVDQDLVAVYKCLISSYENLRNEKAQKLFLLCSIFPEDYEIPLNLIIRLCIGAGIFGKVENYCAARSQVLGVKNELVASTLLLKVDGKECVKMHDLVREVALWVAKEDIQVIMDSRTTLETSKRIVFWSTNDFPDHFDGTNLKILFLWIKGDVLVKNPKTLFAGVADLSILFLLGRPKKHSIPSLSQSLLSLKNMQTLILDGWELGDISILKNLQSLVTLELKNCLLTELPKDIKELKKLRLLGLRKCEIQKNNPFQVIETCSQLEELHFVENADVGVWKLEHDKETGDEITHDISPPILGMFCIACDGFEYFYGDDNGLFRCFNTKHLEDLISKAMFKYIVGRAEVLELGKREKTGWKCLIPDIVPVEGGGMNDLIKLCLYEWDEIECLIDTREHGSLEGFSKLVELHIEDVDVQKLCKGPVPSCFLRKLQNLRIERCKKLQNIFFDVNFEVPRLKVLTLRNCPMFSPSIFPLSVAQSLVHLEKFTIEDCEDLKSLITYESLRDELGDIDKQKGCGLPFPNLKFLRIQRCHKLELVSPLFLAGDLLLLEEIWIMDCKELKYIFGECQNEGHVLHQEIVLPSLKEMVVYFTPNFISMFRELKKCMLRPSSILKEDLKEKHENSIISAFSWAPGCCFLPATKDTDTIGASNGAVPHHQSIPVESFHAVECLMRQPMNLRNIRHMSLLGCSKLESLFSVSIARTIMLEELAIVDCGELKRIITNEVENDGHLSCTSIFSKLQKLHISSCKKLKFIFPFTFSRDLKKLKSIFIHKSDELEYVFEKYLDEERLSNENENSEPDIELPALEKLSLECVPNLRGICIKNHQQECSSLLTVGAPKESCASSKRIEPIHTAECLMRQTMNLQNVRQMKFDGCSKLKSLFSVSIATTIMLEELVIESCGELKHIIKNGVEDDGHLNCTSIFPQLQSLLIRWCNKLEFIFPSTFSGGLQKLKSINISGAAELKYVFGKYHEEECLANESENKGPHIDLPALEKLFLYGVPNMTGICIEKYQLECSSLQTMEAPKESCASSKRIETFHTAECLMRQPLKLQNVRQMTVDGCFKLKSLFSVSIATTIMLEELVIGFCGELKHIITNEVEDDGHLSCTSIFPKLQSLKILHCNKLEFIFPSTFSGGLQKLKSIDIDRANELKYIFGKYDEEECLSNENENSEPHMDLPALENLCLREVPNMRSICIKNYQLECSSLQTVKAPKESCASNKRIETFHTAECLMRQPLSLQNIRHMKLEGCSKLESLVSVSIARTIMLEELEIIGCAELKHIIRNGVEDDGHLNCTSIFPKLQSLLIRWCNKLEFIFPSTFSRGLQKLKSIDINGANELKYVFGKYHEEECLSNESEDNGPHIELPALEKLFLYGVANMRGICIKKYQLECSSLQTVEAPKEIKEHMEDVTSEAAKESEIQEIVNADGPMTPTVGFQYFLNFHNLKYITIWEYQNLRTVFSVSACKILQQLSNLDIGNCKELVNVVEEDSNDDHHMKYSSIFPKLVDLRIWKCDKLEFIFPFSLLGGLQKLKSLKIGEAAELKYIFGTYEDGDHLSNENAGNEHHIDLPALEELALRDVPKMINNIWTKKYHLRLRSLQSIDLDGQQFSGGSFVDLMAYLQGMAAEDSMTIIKDVQKLTYLAVNNSKIGEVLNLEGVEIECPMTLSLGEMRLQCLSELKHIWKGPKYILSLPNLSKLHIIKCKKLRAIFCVSISKSLPQLTSLHIEDCDELVDIIEESVEDHLPQLLFPELKDIEISRCNRLKCLFSITTPSMFPKLESLEIQEASELEQVFKRKHDDTKKMVLKDVFPILSDLILEELPILVAICDGIDFQTLENLEVVNCPKYKEVTSQLQEGPSNLNSKNQVNTEGQVSLKFDNAQVVPYVGETSGSSSKFAESYKETEKEIDQGVPDPASKLPATTSSALQITEETLIEVQAEDPTPVSEKHASETSLVESQLRRTPLHSMDPLIQERVQEGPTSKDAVGATMVADLTATNSSSKLITPLQNEFPVNVAESFSEDTSVMKNRMVAASVCSQPAGLQYGPSTLSLEIGKEAAGKATASTLNTVSSNPKSSEAGKGTVRIHASQVPTTTTTRNRETVKETRDDSSVQEEPEVIPSPPHQAQIASVGTSSPKLGICEIFQLVELKHGETALLAQALERYPQLLLPREHRTPRIIAWSYRVLVDILVMLATKTAYTITPSEKSTLKENLSEAIILGFDNEWVESVCAKVFGSDMSDVSAAKEEIQVMEDKLGEIDSQLLGLSEDRKNLTQKITMLGDIISAKYKPFGI